MKRLLSLFLWLWIGLSPSFATLGGGAGVSMPRGAPSTGAIAYPNEAGVSTLMVFTPFHDFVFDQTVLFSNANDVGDFVGTSTGTQDYALAEDYFAGYSGSNARIAFTRISQGGGRARMIGAVREFAPLADSIANSQTACVSGEVYCNLAALQAAGGDTLTLTINGQTVTATLPSLTGASWSTIASDVAAAIASAQAASPFATAIVGQITPASCTVTGYIVTGLMTVLTATGGAGVDTPASNCVTFGGLLECSGATLTNFPCGSAFSGWVGQMFLGQLSGTTGGAGVYAVWDDNGQQIEALQNNFGSQAGFASWQENWGVLSVTSAGASDTIAVGEWITGSGVSDAAVMANISPGGISSCTGAACANTVWALSYNQGGSSVPSSGTETMGAQGCPVTVTANAYTGAVNNSLRFWYELSAYCPYYPSGTLTYASGAAASLLGWTAAQASSAGASPVSWPYGGNYFSPAAEVLGMSPGQTSYAAWLESFVSSNFSDFTADQFWGEPDLGLNLAGAPTPTYKNAITAWHAGLGDAHVPLSTYTYARVFSTTAYPVASYPLPTCTPNSQVLTASGNFTPDYCPVHDFYLIGEAGTTGASTTGTGTDTGAGGVGSSGGMSFIQGMTTNSGVSTLAVTVGAGGTGTNTQVTMGSLIGGGTFVAQAGNAGANATAGGAGGTVTATTCTEYAAYGNAGTVGCFSGRAGVAGATGGVGGGGGSSAASLTHIGYSGGAAEASGGAGGAGSAAAGATSSSSTGGSGGASADGTAGGAGGATTVAGTAPGGGGGGSTTAAGEPGAAGHNDTSLTTLTHPCSSGGFGGGGGGGGRGLAASGAGNGGNGGLYGGSGGAGGSLASAGKVGTPGTPAGGFACRVGYED